MVGLKKINTLHLIQSSYAFHRMGNLLRSFIDWLSDEKSKNSVFVGGGVFYGWMLGIFTLLHASGLGVIFTWEFLVKTSVGIGIAVVTAALVKLGVLFTDNIYTSKIKPKFFKDDKEEKRDDSD